MKKPKGFRSFLYSQSAAPYVFTLPFVLVVWCFVAAAALLATVRRTA